MSSHSDSQEISLRSRHKAPAQANIAQIRLLKAQIQVYIIQLSDHQLPVKHIASTSIRRAITTTLLPPSYPKIDRICKYTHRLDQITKQDQGKQLSCTSPIYYENLIQIQAKIINQNTNQNNTGDKGTPCSSSSPSQLYIFIFNLYLAMKCPELGVTLMFPLGIVTVCPPTLPRIRT